MKEELKRLKAGLLAVILCLTLSACNKEEEKIEDSGETLVVFIDGKALIYSGDYKTTVSEDYSAIGGNSFKYTEVTRFSPGTDAVEVQSREDAIELATAVVGEENIIYIDYEGKDMKLTYGNGN